MKCLYISDLDDTLLNQERKVSETSKNYLNESIKNGINFSIATARTPGTVEDLMSGISCEIPFVLMTGAALWDPKTKKFENVKSLSNDKAKEIQNIFEKNEVPALIYSLQDNKIHLYRTPGKGYSEEEQEFIDCKRDKENKFIHIDFDGKSDIPDNIETPIFFFSMQPQENIDKVRKELDSVSGIDILEYKDNGFPGMTIMEIRKEGVSKASAIKELKEIYGFDKVIAFGDNKNDIPMITEADWGVAVGNAIPELKEIADEVIEKNTEDAVAKYIFLMSL